jgi:TonB family protein
MMAVAQGGIEERRARYPEALALFDQARQDPACRVEAQLGMARTFNSMNDHKEALAAARWVLSNTPDEELLGEAHYEIGRALHKAGKKMTKQKAAAEASYLRAVELTEGEQRAAVRALMRLYRETRREEDLAALQERFPDIRASTRAERKRLLVDLKKKRRIPQEAPSLEGWTVAAGGAVDCATREPTSDSEWELDLPTNCDDPDVELRAKVASPSPQYTDEDRQARIQGLVQFEARVNAAGEVDVVRILDSLSPGLDTSTLAAVCLWQFEPAGETEGSSRSFYYCGTASFRLQ